MFDNSALHPREPVTRTALLVMAAAAAGAWADGGSSRLWYEQARRTAARCSHKFVVQMFPLTAGIQPIRGHRQVAGESIRQKGARQIFCNQPSTAAT